MQLLPATCQAAKLGDTDQVEQHPVKPDHEHSQACCTRTCAIFDCSEGWAKNPEVAQFAAGRHGGSSVCNLSDKGWCE